jgi:hypothetical protein
LKIWKFEKKKSLQWSHQTVTPCRISKSPGFISSLFLLLFEMTFDMKKKRDQKKKDVRTWESEHKECIWPEGTPSTTVKTIFSTLYIPIRIRRCGPAKWIEMYMILPSFYPNHRWFFLYVLHTSNVKWSERKIKRLKCVGWKDEVNAGKLYNNSKEEEKKRFFSGSAVRKSNRRQSHPLSHSHDKKKERKKIRRNLKKREIACGTLKMNWIPQY